MALKGTLKDFGLADIFQLIGIQRKTGVLVLTSGESRVTVSFLSGSVVSADSSERTLEDRLGTVLVKSGKITSRQLADALKSQKLNPQRLGKILTESGAISASDLSEALRVQVTQIVHHLFRWKDGDYDFSQEETIDYDREHFHPVPAENILMEGARMLDEWPIIERRIRGFDMVLQRRTADGGGGARPVSVFDTDIDFDLVKTTAPAAAEPADPLNEEETLVYGFVDGRSTIQDIVDRCHLGEFETCRILYELMSRDLVEESTGIGPGGAPAPAAHRQSGALRAALLLLPALAALSMVFATRSPLSPLGSNGSDPFGVDRIRLHMSQARLARIDQALHLYHLDRQGLPATLEILVREGFLRHGDLLDPWQRPYVYEIGPGGYSITGYGASGTPDRQVSIYNEFGGGERLALEGGIQAAPFRR